ncbi:MAG TPA: CoA transferase [Candidatus Binataceae bacterium]|nr:CoA transferase [Candidatus Binataceae bacterium]
MGTAENNRSMLSGIKVLDFTQYLAGPTVTRLMAEMGAEIIKVEIAPMGDPSRILPFIKSGRSGYFVQQNRGKKSLCLNFEKPEALEIIRALVPKVDVVVENFGPGVMQKRGLDYHSLKQINPRLIMASLSAFGRNSPLAHKTGYDMIAQAFSGLMHMTGEPSGPPTFVGIGIADVGSGVHTFAAIGYALFYRDRTGIGQYIDMAMIDTLYHMHDFGLQGYSITDGEFQAIRMGRYHNQICPAGVFKAPQGWIFILVLDRQWANLVKAMNQPDLKDDPRFASGAARVENRDQVNQIVQQWIESFPTDEAVLSILEESRVPCAPVLSLMDTLKHPYFKAREMVREVPDPILGQVTIPGFPFKFSAVAELPELEAPLLGQHGPQVLKDFLGFSDQSIGRLQQEGVLFSDNR